GLLAFDALLFLALALFLFAFLLLFLQQDLFGALALLLPLAGVFLGLQQGHPVDLLLLDGVLGGLVSRRRRRGRRGRRGGHRRRGRCGCHRLRGAAGITVPMSMKTASIGSPAAWTVVLDCIQNIPLNAIARHST